MKLEDWDQQTTYESAKPYSCGFCHLKVAARTGFGKKGELPLAGRPGRGSGKFQFEQRIALCPNCGKPTYWDDDRQVPGPVFGDDVDHLPPDIAELYGQARNCMAVNAFTAGAMVCRKILMNVAVARGAPENLTFKAYVEHLEKNGCVPPDGKEWVNHIRDKGNEANHEIQLTAREDLVDLLVFSSMLLCFIFEFPARLKKKLPPGP